VTHPASLFLFVDGHSLAYRAFYAFFHSRDGGLRTSTGIPTSVCYGFLRALLDVLEQEKPSHVAVAFDTRQPTFRHEADETYKAGRPETPEEFTQDIENLKHLLMALNIPILTAPGYEADDILGTLVAKAPPDIPIRILSGDQDLFQLIEKEDRVRVLHLNNKDKTSDFTAEKVKEKLGIWPWQVVDYKALCGDPSDNIPGVKGIGQKRAVELLNQYETLDRILDSIGEMKGAMKTRLEEGIEAARHSQFMARIKQDIPLEINWEIMRLTGFDQEQLLPLLQQLEFQGMINKIQKIQAALGGIQAPTPSKTVVDVGEYSDSFELSDEALWFDFTSIPVSQVPPVQVLDTPEALDHFVHILEKNSKNIVAWDTETTSLNIREAEIVGIGCCWSPTDIVYIPIAHRQGSCLPWERVKTSLDRLWRDPKYPKVLQNAKYDRGVLRANGVILDGVVFDPMLASYVLNPEGNHRLSDLAAEFLNLAMESYTHLVGKKRSIAEIDIHKVAQYCGADAYCTYQLVPILTAKLQENPRLWDLFEHVELPLAQVLEEMEWQGIRVNIEFLNQFSQQLQEELTQLEIDSYRLAGETFNLNSPKQLATILFEKLKLSTQKTRKNSQGYSTDAAVLEKLEGDHPVISKIIQHRTLAKLKSTYVDALPNLVNLRTGRVHTSFNQTVTATGRLSSSDPNLQNIPIRTEFSRQIRTAFIPQEGWLLAAADYSQIELRILAHLSQETTLIEGFKAGEDIHTLTAKLLLGKSEVTSDERRMAKTINYGVIYGMGAQRFARATGVSVTTAKQFIQHFNRQYAGIFQYIHSTENFVMEHGYVETIQGRRRYFPLLKKLTGYRKEAELRAAVNAPIQGSASDVIKIAMVNLHHQLQNYQSRLLLQVHDELVFEIEPSEWAILEPLIRQAMERAVTLSVPLTVDIQIGKNWREAK
jgi:DNA polymerase-1